MGSIIGRTLLKQLGLVLILLAGSLAQAGNEFEPYPHIMVGSFKYQGNYKVSVVRLEDDIDAVNDQGKERLRQRIAEGFTCTADSGAKNSCYKYEKPDQADATVKRSVDYDYQNYLLTLGAPQGSPELVYDGEDYKQWKVLQAASCDTIKFKSVVYLNAQGVEKITMGPDENGTSFYYDYDQGMISVPRLMNLKRGDLLMKVFVLVRLDSFTVRL